MRVNAITRGRLLQGPKVLKRRPTLGRSLPHSASTPAAPQLPRDANAAELETPSSQRDCCERRNHRHRAFRSKEKWQRCCVRRVEEARRKEKKDRHKERE